MANEQSSNTAGTARPLVFRCGAFGDMVLLTPLIRQLAARFASPVDIVTSGGWSQPLLAGQPGVGEVFTLGSRKTPYWFDAQQRRLVAWLRTRGVGPVWYGDSGTGRSLLGRGGIGDDWICDVRDLPAAHDEHYVDRWIRFAAREPRALAGRVPPPAPAPRHRAAVLQIDASQRSQLRIWLDRRGLAERDCVLVQAGNKRTMRGAFRKRATNVKYWPEPRWGEVVRAVRTRLPDASVLLLGVPAEFALNEDIRAAAGVDGVHNVADDLPIDVLLALCEQAHSMISVDTGPAHAAAALGCPTVALFATADPVLYRPGGVDTPASALSGSVDGRPNILGIEAAQVIGAWTQLTAHRRARAGA